MSDGALRPIMVVLKVELPTTVDGGLTLWSIERDYNGKGGKRLAINARCIQTGEIIKLIDGREGDVMSAIKVFGILFRPETTAYKIALKLIREGRAVQVRR